MLNPLKVRPKPKTSKFHTADFETWDGLKGTQFRMGANYNGVRTRVFHSLHSFMSWKVASSNTTYFHNLSFDGRFILDWLVKNEIYYKNARIKPIYSAGIIAILFSYENIKGNKVRIKFIDSVGLLRAGQAKLEEAFLGKVEKHFIDWSVVPSDEELEKRVISDVKGMWKVLNIFFNMLYDEYNYWAVGDLTLGSITIKVLRTNYLPKPYYNAFVVNQKGGGKHVMRHLDAVIREGYFGGNTGVYGNITGGEWEGETMNELDANSFYPAQYAKPMPSGEYQFTPYVGTIPQYEGFFMGSIYEYKSHLPILPTRYTGKTVFGYGQKVGVWGLPLIRYALKLGRIRIDKGYFAISKTSNPILERFGKGIYANRLRHKVEGNDVMVYIDKLLLNNGYGKLGQKLEYKSFYVQALENFNEDIITHEEVARKGDLYLISEDIESSQDHQMVDKAAYITSYTLVELHKEMEKCKFLCYTDTDSIHGILGDHNEGKNLGAWKQEYYKIIKAYYLLPKLYWILYEDEEGVRHTKCVAKGFDGRLFRWEGKAEQRFIPFEEFCHIVLEGYEMEIYMGLKSALRNRGSILESYIRRRKTKTTVSDKRLYHSDGTTEPIRVIAPKGEYKRIEELVEAAQLEQDATRYVATTGENKNG